MWYGGGCDLTPFYVCEEDFAEFHAFWKAACDAHAPQVRAPGRASGRPRARRGAAWRVVKRAGRAIIPAPPRPLPTPCLDWFLWAAAIPRVQGLVRPILLHPLPQGESPLWVNQCGMKFGSMCNLALACRCLAAQRLRRLLWPQLLEARSGAGCTSTLLFGSPALLFACRPGQEHRGVGGLFFDDVDAAAAGYHVEQVGRCSRAGAHARHAGAAGLRPSHATCPACPTCRLPSPPACSCCAAPLSRASLSAPAPPSLVSSPHHSLCGMWVTASCPAGHRLWSGGGGSSSARRSGSGSWCGAEGACWAGTGEAGQARGAERLWQALCVAQPSTFLITEIAVDHYLLLLFLPAGILSSTCSMIAASSSGWTAAGARCWHRAPAGAWGALARARAEPGYPRSQGRARVFHSLPSASLCYFVCCFAFVAQSGVHHGVRSAAHCLEIQRAAGARLGGGAPCAAAAAAARVGVRRCLG